MRVSSLRVGSHLTLHNKNYRILRKVQQDIFLENVDDLAIINKTESELLQSLAKGHMNLIGDSQTTLAKNRKNQDLTSLDDEQKDVIYLRHKFINRAILILGKQPTTVGLQAIIDEVGGQLELTKLPSLDSVYKWWKRHYRSGGDILSLKNRKTGKVGPRRFTETVLNEIKEIIEEEYLIDTRPTIAHVYRLLEHRMELINRLRPTPLKLPSLAQFYRIINGLDQHQVMKHRKGRKAADKHFRLSGAGPTVEMILERAEIDHSPANVLIVDETTGIVIGRPTITLIIDAFSRMILGLYIGFEPPSLVAVMRALRHAIMPKDKDAYYLKDVSDDWSAYGIPMTLICDNGSEFHAETLKRLCAELNINLQFCPKSEPNFKGRVERLVGTINSEVCDPLPGTTFSSIAERGDYESGKFAIVTEKELKSFICRWIVDIYHNRVHSTTKRTPLAMWKEGLEQVTPLLPESESSLAFVMTHEETRRLTHKGIEIFSMFYNSVVLRELRCRKEENYDVIVRADPEDLGKIWVLDEENGDYISVPSIMPEYATGLSLRQHKHIRKHLIDKGLGEQNKKAVIEHIYRLNEDIKELKSSNLQKQRRKAAQLTQENQSELSSTVPEAVPDDILSSSSDSESFDVFEFASDILEESL